MKDEVVLEIKKNSTVLSLGSVMPSYDLFVTLVSKDNNHFNEVLYDLMSKIKTKLNYHDYFIVTEAYLYPLKVFGVKERDAYSLVSESEETAISKKDFPVLKALERGGTSKIVELGKEAKISSKLMIYKIKKLKSSNTILGSRIHFDMNKLRYSFTSIRINIDNLSQETQSKMSYFAKENKHIDSLTFGISKLNCMIQMVHKDQGELNKTINEIYKQLEIMTKFM